MKIMRSFRTGWVCGMALLGIFMWVLPGAGAELKLAPLFSSNMVLQSGMPVPVWGVAEPAENVSVTFLGRTKTSRADDKGQWRVTLDSLKVSDRPQVLQVISGRNKIEIPGILVGEVWLCSGQSNMERELGPRPPQPLVLNWEQEVAAADYPLIRQFLVEGSLTLAPQGRADSAGRWVTCSPETAGKFSAVAYFFARELHKARKVPVGIIVSAVGGTPAELWISKDAMAGIRDSVPAGLMPQFGCHYHSKIQPLQPVAMRGVAWYQGESNNGHADKYQAVLTALIKDWRQAWGRDFPFLFVQIPPHAYVPAELREGQLQTFLKVPNTGMVVTMDCGYSDPTDWHPANKAPVGARLALAARAIAYGEKIEWSGPVYSGMKVNGSKATIAFTHVGGGLVAKDGELKGFEIAGADGKFVQAQAVIKGGTVEVSSPAVAAPATVTFGWKRVPDVNLFNKEGLPASPFRTGPCPSTL